MQKYFSGTDPMTRRLPFFVVVLVLAVGTLTAQTRPPMQKGISVEMAKTESAQLMPAADDANAWIITIDRFGTLFFRANHTDLDELASWMKFQPHDRDANLYIKADGGVGFVIVRKVLNAGRDAGFLAPVLLTSQPAPPSEGGVTPPMGVAVQMGSSAQGLIPVYLVKTNHPAPLLRINNQPIPEAAFAMTLTNVLEGQKDKTVVLKPDDQLLFSQVVHAIDQCRSAGANVALGELP